MQKVDKTVRPEEAMTDRAREHCQQQFERRKRNAREQAHKTAEAVPVREPLKMPHKEIQRREVDAIEHLHGVIDEIVARAVKIRDAPGLSPDAKHALICRTNRDLLRRANDL